MSFCSESRQHSIILGASFFSFQGTYLLLKACNLRFTICYLGFQDFFFSPPNSPAAAVQSNCGSFRTVFHVDWGGYLRKEPFFSHPNSIHSWLEGCKQLLEDSKCQKQQCEYPKNALLQDYYVSLLVGMFVFRHALLQSSPLVVRSLDVFFHFFETSGILNFSVFSLAFKAILLSGVNPVVAGMTHSRIHYLSQCKSFRASLLPEASWKIKGIKQ